MDDYLALLAGLLLLTILIGLVRIFIGPDPVDRLLVTQLFGTAGVAVLLLLAVIQVREALLNAALVLALLAPLTLITFMRLMSGHWVTKKAIHQSTAVNDKYQQPRSRQKSTL